MKTIFAVMQKGGKDGKDSILGNIPHGTDNFAMLLVLAKRDLRHLFCWHLVDLHTAVVA